MSQASSKRRKEVLMYYALLILWFIGGVAGWHLVALLYTSNRKPLLKPNEVWLVLVGPLLLLVFAVRKIGGMI